MKTLVASVWVLAIASAVLLTYKIHRPLVSHETPVSTRAPSEPLARQEADEPDVDATEEQILVMPVVVIVGHMRGSAEMQGARDLVIGPGTVTYPDSSR
jgi:hypothetical protein